MFSEASKANTANMATGHDLIASAGGLLIDWDGCIALGDAPLPGAIRFLQANQSRVAVLSNNSTALPQDFSAILERAGVTLPIERIVLAGAETLRQASAAGLRQVTVLANSRMKAHARALGLTLVKERPEAVILMRHTRFSFTDLQRAVDAVSGGARLIVSNADNTHPGRNGRLVPETGALLSALRSCLPHAEPEIVGKPQALLFHRACEVLGISPDQAVMIGDNPDTDIKGARALGMGAVLIGPQGDMSALDLRLPAVRAVALRRP